MTPWGFFLFDFVIYEKYLLNEKTDLKVFLSLYKIKQFFLKKLRSFSFGNYPTETSF